MAPEVSARSRRGLPLPFLFHHLLPAREGMDPAPANERTPPVAPAQSISTGARGFGKTNHTLLAEVKEETRGSASNYQSRLLLRGLWPIAVHQSPGTEFGPRACARGEGQWGEADNFFDLASWTPHPPSRSSTNGVWQKPLRNTSQRRGPLSLLHLARELL